MRTILIRVFSEDGKLFVQENVQPSLTTGELWNNFVAAHAAAQHRLDVLERDGPWKPDAKLVELSVSPGPQEVA